MAINDDAKRRAEIYKKALKKHAEDCKNKVYSVTRGKNSDLGFYGRTGYCHDHNLTNKKCSCGEQGVLYCEYDDTPGFKETAYFMFCPDCKVMSSHTDNIENVISSWEGMFA